MIGERASFKSKSFTVYPEHCENYYGPHSVECLETMWYSAQCLVKGSELPRNLTTEQHAELDSKDLRFVFLSSCPNQFVFITILFTQDDYGRL